ncbi:MAG: HipA domain-containing protein [Coriobacteriia bacterium]|nr:HipA domain-containing protein [Coriobacteriia bacterium]
MNSLNVELYGVLLGTLRPEERSFSFEAASSVFEHYPVASTIMSLAVPLNLKFTAPQKRRAINFFAELLPEGRNLDWLYQTLPPDQRNTWGLLRTYGKDIAGALIISDPDDPASAQSPKAEPVDNQQIRHLLEHMPQAPLANSPLSGKTSLGGMQGKIVLARQGGAWCRAHYGLPSTHILKPVVPEFPMLIYDEAFCMQLAQRVGLTSHPVWIEDFAGLDALVIERFDRDDKLPDGRLHQEDFNQALGAHGDQKYQEAGGKVSAKRIAQTLERFSNTEDVAAFADQLVFAVAVGNLDMHAKNISVFHLPNGDIKLTPAYDQVPLRHQPTDNRMALALAGEYVHANLTRTHITTELLSWKTTCFHNEKEADSFVRDRLEAIHAALADLPLPTGAYPQLKDMIATFITRLLSGKPTGKLNS